MCYWNWIEKGIRGHTSGYFLGSSAVLLNCNALSGRKWDLSGLVWCRLHQRTLRINYSEQLYGCVVLNTFLTLLVNRNVILKNLISKQIWLANIPQLHKNFLHTIHTFIKFYWLIITGKHFSFLNPFYIWRHMYCKTHELYNRRARFIYLCTTRHRRAKTSKNRGQ